MTQQSWLIAGGAGYVGSHIADLFLAINKRIYCIKIIQSGLWGTRTPDPVIKSREKFKLNRVWLCLNSQNKREEH